MSFVGVLAVFFGIIFGVLIIVGFWFGFIKLVFPDFPHFFKYKILKKKAKEEDITFLFDLISNGKTRKDVLREALLSNKYTPKKANELNYLFLEVEKSMKGGVI